MKRIYWLLLGCFAILSSCSKKTHPSVSTNNPSPRIEERPRIPDTMTAAADSAVTTPAAPAPVVKNFSSPMVVIDAGGKIITSKENLPEDIASRVKYSEIARAYTPVQKNNLIVRFKMVPPKVLYVPKELAQKSAKGSYIIYKKKFWYWKKEDGLFHLDDTYYQ
jgi:hypothetical protein